MPGPGGSFEGFEELEDELEELAEDFDSLADKHGSKNARGAMEDGIASAMEEIIIPQARADAPGGTSGKVASQINEQRRGWTGNTYRHVISGGELAAIHEWGSGARATDPSKRWGQPLVPRDGNPPMGYLIPRGGTGGPVAVNLGGETAIFEYVVHPGVPAQHMIRNAIRDNTEAIQHRVWGHLGARIRNELRS